MIAENSDDPAPAAPSRGDDRRDWRAYWNEHPREFGETDFFYQVDRTVAGRAVGEEEQSLIVHAVVSGLRLNESDTLLDVCCGNGLLTRSFAGYCRQVVGVDYSDALIGVAKTHQAAANVFYLAAAADVISPKLLAGHSIDKICMCAGLQYFTEREARVFLRIAAELIEGRGAMYFTDVPDMARIRAFYNTPERWADYERRKRSGTEAIGSWWDRSMLTEMLRERGYRAVFVAQDPRRSTAHYRFDLLGEPFGG